MSDNTVAEDIRWEVDAEGILTLTLDAVGQSANTLGPRFTAAIAAAYKRVLAEQAALTGVVITSAKKTFVAGADLNQILAIDADTVGEFAALLDDMKAHFRAVETSGLPVVAAINGSALGGGLELALSCHRRIALDSPKIEIGLPESQLGLLPGGGGLTRTVRMFGVQQALLQVLIKGQKYRPAKALELGLIDEVASTPEELIANAKAWIKANPNPRQPWDVKGYMIPGGTPSTPAFAQMLPALPANLRKQLKGQPMPAARAILCAAVEGTQVDFDNASLIETRYLAELLVGPVSKNMISTFFFDLQSINKGGSRPAGYPVTTFSKTAVLGAGMMGAGIAYVQARAGMTVYLKDLTIEAAEKGKDYSRTLLDKAVAKGGMTQEKRDEILARIICTDAYDDFAGADLVVEAVFEDPDLKKQVFAGAEKVAALDALLGSNTSTLPISDLQTGVSRAEDFIGLHFFSPVDKMPLVEIVVGEKTSDATLAKAIDYTLAIKKVPIVVNDSRGFFTSRVIGGFLDEALEMLCEGVSPVSIEQAGTQAGYPAAPLQLYDELTLTLPLKIHRSMEAGYAAEGRVSYAENATGALAAMVEKLGRHGRSSGAGFYDYDEDGKRGKLWPGLRHEFGGGNTDVPFEDMKERMLIRQAVDTVRCFDEGVLRTVPDANIGSILGIGFPAWTGGLIQYIKQYDGGIAGFVVRAQELAERYGERFTPSQTLLDAAKTGELTL